MDRVEQYKQAKAKTARFQRDQAALIRREAQRLADCEHEQTVVIAFPPTEFGDVAIDSGRTEVCLTCQATVRYLG